MPAALGRYDPHLTLTRSELEQRVLCLCQDHGLPRPLVNATVLGFEVDFLWPEAMLVVETDGRESHQTRAAFERDRARHARLTAAGYRVLRFTWRQVVEQAAETAALLRKLLLPQPPRTAPRSPA